MHFVLSLISHGVGSGATDFSGYDSYVKEKLQSPELWRCLYYGYIGTDWRDTTVESDDDWYFVTKTVVHCLVMQKSPKELYTIPTWIASSDISAGLTLEDTQRRGKKVLDEAEKLYNKCLNSSENYETASVEINKSGTTYTSGDYEVQDFKITSNKALGDYDVTLRGFPEDTIYEKNGSTLKVKIPRNNITEDISGLVYLTNIEVETCGAFYAEAYNSDFQDYIIAADPWEVTSARAEFDLSTDKSKIKIEKVDEDTKEPISGVTFQLKDEKGTVIQNATTNTEGIATFSKLRPGKYIISEVSTNDNYILDTTEHTINVGYDLTIEKQFTNKHKTGDLKIFKVDADNNKIALGGVEFELYSEELDKIVGTYKTDENGEILIKDLRTGNYKLIETKTNKWYNLAEDTELEVKWNNENSITITNELKKGQIKIVKVDADNNEIRLAGVEFEILDNNNNVLEKVITDENGEALTSRYAVRDYNNLKIRELNTLEDYVLIDDILNVELKANETTSLVIENEHIKGQIEITKVDKDDNSILLEGAEFGLYNENDELIETLTTDKSGKALSDKLYKGNYYLKELSSGSKYYLLNNETFKFEIVNNNEIIPITVENEKVKISVDVEKTGYIETQKNDTIKYDFSNIANTANIYLDSFKWRDYLPTDYIRLEEIVTGTWNQEITYSITYKTNLNNEERILKENLDSKQNYKIDCTDIDLKEGEYITEFCFDFGKVDVGFKEDIPPAIFCKVLDTVENKDTFTNKTSTEGEYEDLKDRAEDEWTTVVYEKDVHANKLPKTGF